MRGLLSFFFVLLSGSVATAAPPAFQDTMAQRTLACTSCHGKEGRAGPDGYYPRIAGKPAGYLYAQLLHFREGCRHYGLMAGCWRRSPTNTCTTSRCISRSWTCPTPRRNSPRRPGGAQRGRELVARGDPERRVPACASCHGKALTGVAPNVPGLLGLPRDYLLAQLGAWRTGQRRALAPDCMAEIARRLAPDDLSAVTAFLAAEPLPAHAKPAAATPATARTQAPGTQGAAASGPGGTAHALRRCDSPGRGSRAMKRIAWVLVAVLAGLAGLVWMFNFWGAPRIRDSAPTTPVA